MAVFGPKRDEVSGEWKTIHNEKLGGVYAPPNMFRVIRSRRMR